jgi:predicted nucleotidyltransferase
MRRSKEIFEEIERRKDLVVKEFRPEAVILFGSFAKGDINEGSDVDAMVIADFKEGFLERVELPWDLKAEIKRSLEPVGYTPEEFQRMREEGNSSIREVLESGKLLYGIMPGGGPQVKEVGHE